VHILIIKTDSCTYGQTLLSGLSSTFCVWHILYLAYGAMGKEGLLPIGVLRSFLLFPPIYGMLNVNKGEKYDNTNDT
jgi:hypothetical protein